MRKLFDSIVFWGGFGLGAAGAFRHFGRISQSLFRQLGSAENGSMNSLAASIAQPLKNHMVAGPASADAIRAAKVAQDAGMAASIAYLSKPIQFSHQAIAIRDQLLALLTELHEAELSASVSINPSQLGLHLSQELAHDNLTAILTAAQTHNQNIILNMEDSASTAATIALFEQALVDGWSNPAITLQANLYRTANDLELLLALGARIRLCRGGYAESAEYAFQSAAEIETNFLSLSRRLLAKKHEQKHAFATHDGSTLQSLINLIPLNGAASDEFELHMHYGVQPAMQAHMHSLGYQVRQYIPYGSEWQAWVLGRLAERDDGVMMLIGHV